MSRTGFASQRVQTWPHALALQPFLQGALKVRKLAGRTADFCNLRPYQAIDDAPWSIEAGIHIHRAKNCFERINKEGLLSSPAGFFLPFAKMKVSAQFQLLRISHEVS